MYQIESLSVLVKKML